MKPIDDLRATAHPVRLQLLSLVTGASFSAAEAARELGLTQAAVSYHLRVLERVGLVRVVEVVRLRGGEAKRYRHETSSRPFRLDDTKEARSEPEDVARYVEAMTDELRRRSSRRVTGPQISTDAELWVDPETWRRVVTLVGEASALLHSSAVAPRTPGATPVAMTAALFPLRPPVRP
ncbi:helix-turn-helix domain-containing protein [Frigoribacterium sp. 2-23]|uniref:helix-turn-helix domain-containing protein n=1 Tax=Frigoribacterium sp. 2-23 TaxID=3415006 RepID=UPI003C704699